MNKEQLLIKFSAFVETIVRERSPHITHFNGRDWFERWMKIPNIGLGHNKPEDLLESDPDRVANYLNRIEITPFKKPWGY